MKLSKRMSRSGAVLLACAGMVATVYAAPDPALVAAAQKEGEVVWYTSLVVNQVARPMAAAFEREYPGIKVRMTPGRGNDLLLKLLAEGRAGAATADVSHAGSAVGSLMKAGLIAKYVPEESKRYPAEYKDPNGYWTGEVISFLVPAINTDLVKEKDEPHSWNDLLDPKWTGKIAWAQQMTQGGPPGFIGATLAAMGHDRGMEFLRKLAKQHIVNVPASQRVVLDQVISGQYPIALSTFSHHSEVSKKKGAPVKWLKFEYCTGTVDPIFLMKHAPHPNAGKLFIDFVLSKKGQEVFQKADYIPADPSVPAAIPSLKPEVGGFKAIFLPIDQVEKELPHWVKIYNELFR